MSSVRVRVPATTGNLGSGYDCAGMALGLYNTVELSDTESGLDVVVEGEGADAVPRDEGNLCIVSARAVFDAAKWQPSGLRVHMHHAIPVSRGMGSSGVAIVAGAVAANELAGRPLGTSELLRICSDLEGHPDNVVPSLLGGLSISGERSGTIVYQTFPVPAAIKAIVAIPEFTLDTKVARGVLPEAVSMEDAVYNLCSVGLLVGGMLTGELRPAQGWHGRPPAPTLSAAPGSRTGGGHRGGPGCRRPRCGAQRRRSDSHRPCDG